MRGKKAALIAGVCATVAMSAVDTLKVKNMFQLVGTPLGKTYFLHSLGAVQNGIIYGNTYAVSGLDNDSVLIWDANYLDPNNGGVQIPGFYGLKGQIPRPGSNFEGSFPMKLKGDTLIYTDSTDLIAALVADPANPVQLWKKTMPGEIDNLMFPAEDTMYVTRISSTFSTTAFYKLALQGGAEPATISSMKYLHIGETRLGNDRLIGFSADKNAYSWDGVLTERDIDGEYNLGFSPLSVACQGNYSYCTNGSKIYVYDHTNMSSFALTDSASGGGYTSLIYKNLLIVGGGQGARCGIYDISKAPKITQVATIPETEFGDHNSLAVDSATNLLYGIDYNGGGGNWIRVYDLNKYVTATPVNTKPTITSAKTASAKKLALFTYTATATDPESTPTITVDQLPSWLTVSGSTVSGTPSQTAVDTSFRVIASDGTLKDTAMVTVVVGDYDNIAPTRIKELPDTAFQTASPIAMGSLSAYFTDAETPNELTFSVVSNSDNAVAMVAIANGELTYSPGTKNGKTTVIVRATDPRGLFAEDTVVVTRSVVSTAATKTIAGSSVQVGNQIISLAAGTKLTAVSLLDLRGRELFRQTVTGSNVVVPSLGAGVQILRIETTAGIQTVKIGGR